jgi:hypothetical protein
MKINRIISRFSLVLIAIFSLYLHSCEKEEWCAKCEAYICPPFGGILERKLICADSRRQCENNIKDWEKLWRGCFECDEPSPYP